MDSMEVVLLANDVVPGAGLPVAGPGLRQFGLAHGLRTHGIDATILVPRHVAERHWGDQPPPTIPGTVIISASSIRDYLEEHAPSVVVLTNSNQIDNVEGADGCRIVFDMFAPKVLELVCHQDDDLATDDLAALTERKIRALTAADAVLLNGSKKRAYAIGWLLQTGRDIRHVPLIDAPMCLPLDDHPVRAFDGPLRVGIAGYLQEWSVPRGWLDVLNEALDHATVEMHVLLPSHWGGGTTTSPSPQLTALLQHPKTVRHEPKTFSEFREFLASLDLVVDLFERTLEREYAMITRTVVALTSGRPVIHPTFTEVSPYIAEADAGWLTDVEDETRLGEVLADAFSTRADVATRTENALELARRVFAPAAAVPRFVELLHRWQAET